MNKPAAFFDTERPRNLAGVFAGVLFLDQCGKQLALARGAYRANSGALGGLDIDPILGAAALVALILSLRRRRGGRGYREAVTLLGAGAASNLLDRLRWGFIVDYLFLPGCICNLADLALAAGAALLAWRIFRE